MSDDRISRDYLWYGICEERERQDRQWGGPAHDDQHHRRDWIAFIVRFLGKAERHADELAVDGYQAAMISVAALAMAAIESVDRIAYDPPRDDPRATADTKKPAS